MANTALKAKINIENHLSDNVLFRDVSHVAIGVETTGFLFWKKETLNILGRVNSEKELDELNKIITEETSGLSVINTLRVESRA